jgi:phosphoribosylglycinamide formyltransferase-1
MTQIAIFASGTGTNANAIIAYFKQHSSANVELIISDKPSPGVKEYAKEHHVAFVHIPYSKLKDKKHTLSILDQYNIDLIVLAGFMRLIPEYLVQAYRNKILNIHPALLPKYGGKGMYGHRVHERVKAEKEKETGITIHLVDEKYDNGRILFQKSIPIKTTDSVDEIAEKVHTLEHKYFPKVIHSWIRDQFSA